MAYKEYQLSVVGKPYKKTYKEFEKRYLKYYIESVPTSDDGDYGLRIFDINGVALLLSNDDEFSGIKSRSNNLIIIGNKSKIKGIIKNIKKNKFTLEEMAKN